MYDVKKKNSIPAELHTYRLMEATGNLKEQGVCGVLAAATSLGLTHEANRCSTWDSRQTPSSRKRSQSRKRYLDSGLKRVDSDGLTCSSWIPRPRGSDRREYAALGSMQTASRICESGAVVQAAWQRAR